MRKTLMTLLIIAVSGAFLFPTTAHAQDPVQDKIELSREGGTTRIAGNDRMMGMFGLQSTPVAAEVEVFSSNNMVQISVQNYRGPVWVEIQGMRGAKHSSFETFDMGFNAISLSGLGAGEYKIRVTLGTEVFTGTLYKGQYGKRK